MDLADSDTFLFIRRGILQFIIVKPTLALVIMALKPWGLYSDGDISWHASYVYIIFFYNSSVSWCLYCLGMFYYTCNKDLAPYRPFPKFLCVKSIIFLTFW